MIDDEVVEGLIAKLQYLHDVPVDELQTGIEEINVRLIGLRDGLIERRRREPHDRKTACLLGEMNVALSLIFGLEYPVTGFQRNKIRQTIGVLKNVVDRAQAEGIL